MSNFKRLIGLLIALIVAFMAVNYSRAVDEGNNRTYENNQINNGTALAFDYESFRDNSDYEDPIEDTKVKEKEDLTNLKESSTTSPDKSGVKDFICRFFMLTFFLMLCLIFIKEFISKKINKISLENVVKNLTQFRENFIAKEGLKLKQKLALAPGQNVYLVEIAGKELLIGGTPKGGIQFLTDLSKEVKESLNEIKEENKTEQTDKKNETVVNDSHEEKNSVNRIRHFVLNTSNQTDLKNEEIVENTKKEFENLEIFTDRFIQDPIVENPFLNVVDAQKTSCEKSSKGSISLEAKKIARNKTLTANAFKRRTNFKKSFKSC